MNTETLQNNSIDFLQYLDTYNLTQEINFKRSCIEHNGEPFYVKYQIASIVQILPTDNGTYRCYHSTNGSIKDIRECNFDEFTIDFSDGSVEMC
jgi:hypothetical protein